MSTMKIRIQNKIDTYERWLANNPVPLKGEICIATVPASTGAVKQEPATLIKVGDGVTEYKLLPFLTAIAGDVADWAKADVKPEYAADEITGIDTYIASYVEDQMGISVDTDTQYQLVKVDDYNYKLQSKGKTDEAWADVENGAIAIPKYDDTALAERVTGNEEAIEALQGLVGDKAVATMIAEAIAELDLANTYEAKGEAAKVQGALDAYIEANDAAVAAAKKAGDDAQADVDALELKVGAVTEGKTVVEMIADAQTAATYDDTELTGRVKAIEDDYLKAADKTELEGKVAEAQTAAEKVATDLNTAMDARMQVVEGKAHEHVNKDELDLIVAGDKAKWDAAVADIATVKGDYLKGSDKTEIEGKISAAQQAAEKVATDFNSAMSTRVKAIEDDYLKAADKTELSEVIAAEAARAVDVEGGLETRLAAVEGDYLKAADKTELQGNIDTLRTDLNNNVSGQIKGLRDDFEDVVDILWGYNGESWVDGNKSIRTIANEELAKQLIPENAIESLNTLEEIATWIQNHPDDASAMNEAILALQAQVSGIEAGNGTVKKYVDDAIAALNVGQYALAADLTSLAGRVAVLEAIDHEAYKAYADQAEADAIATSKAHTDALDQSLAPVAKTGALESLITDGSVVFDCGDSDCGGNGPRMITFKIGSTEYQAEEGMTWAEWCDSEYNTDAWLSDSYDVHKWVGDKQYRIVDADSGESLSAPNAVIIANEFYPCVTEDYD